MDPQNWNSPGVLRLGEEKGFSQCHSEEDLPHVEEVAHSLAASSDHPAGKTGAGSTQGGHSPDQDCLAVHICHLLFRSKPNARSKDGLVKATGPLCFPQGGHISRLFTVMCLFD